MNAYKSMIFAPVLLLAATACGAPAGAGSGNSQDTNPGATSAAASTHPSTLVGTWEGDSEMDYEVFDLRADGTCIWKQYGYPADPCTYSVATGDASRPSTNASWMLQVSTTKYNTSLEVVAVDRSQFTVRIAGIFHVYQSVSPDFAKDCVGPGAQPCETVSTETACNSELGCNWDQGCWGTPQSCIINDPTTCSSSPGCHMQQ